MDCCIQKAEIRDIERSAEIIRKAFQTVAEEFDFTIENNPTNGAFLKTDKLLEEYLRGIHMFGLYEGTLQVGFVAIEKKDNTTFYIEKLSVIPQYRHKSYGKSLINYARKFVKENCGKCISIAIIDENTKLKQWYKQYGFMDVSVTKFNHLTFTVCYMEIDV